jgi:peptidoglycan/xylan/chitin deacetylase (PgdA/CDA1 family)
VPLTRSFLALPLAAAFGLLAAGPGDPPAGAAAPRTKVALTFDDLPVHGPLPPGVARLDVVKSILATLKAAKVPPTYGFINAKSADSPETKEFLRLWREAGHPLANHAYSHMDFDTNTVADYTADIAANEEALRALMGGGDWHWFRYPYLREGNTIEKRKAARAFLIDQGYRVAQVTLDFWDWAYNTPYARCAERKDAQGLAWLRESYVSEAAKSLAWGREQARQLYGREIRHVLLLHVGAFQVEMLPKLMALLDQEGFEVVTLEEAQKDAIYADDPNLAFDGGATFLHQVATARNKLPPTRYERPVATLNTICQ